MKQLLLTVLLTLFVVTSAFAFNVGETKFRNTLRLMYQDQPDTTNYQKMAEHILKVTDKRTNFWLYNKVAYRYDKDLPDQSDIRTELGYVFWKKYIDVSVFVARQEWNYKSTNELVWRYGIQFDF